MWLFQALAPEGPEQPNGLLTTDSCETYHRLWSKEVHLQVIFLFLVDATEYEYLIVLQWKSWYYLLL